MVHIDEIRTVEEIRKAAQREFDKIQKEKLDKVLQLLEAWIAFYFSLPTTAQYVPNDLLRASRKAVDDLSQPRSVSETFTADTTG